MKCTGAHSISNCRAAAGHYLDRGDLAAADALLEEVRETGGRQHDFARLAVARGDRQRAHDIMATLRLRAGEAWRPDDAALFGSLQDDESAPGDRVTCNRQRALVSNRLACNAGTVMQPLSALVRIAPMMVFEATHRILMSCHDRNP